MSAGDGQGSIPLPWTTTPADNERIGVMRLRLLAGRTAEEVEAVHLVVLERTVPPRGRHLMRLRDRRYLDALLDAMERHVYAAASADLVGYSSVAVEHRLLEVA